ncbi:MAG: (d)CMP kinase [Patescibacteria group bacterium]|jgi:cytidylate kinase
MIISISGFPGSGKSTIAKLLAEKLKWPRYYMGGLRREAAKKRGLTLAEYNKLGESDPSTDLEVDNYQKKLGEEKDNFIIEGRTSWHFIPHSIKIYLDVNKKAAAKRIFSHLQEENNRNEDHNLKTLEDVEKSIEERYLSDKKRYEQYFNIDVYDKNNYDFYLDTTNFNIQEVFNQVFDFISTKIDIDK